jgi:hypothetical protein
MHHTWYVTLTQFMDRLRTIWRVEYGIQQPMYAEDCSMTSPSMTVNDVMSTLGRLYQFHYGNYRGFVGVSSDVLGGLVQRITGGLPNDTALLANFLSDVMIQDAFQSEYTTPCEVIAVSRIWVHPTFDQWYPMAIQVPVSDSKSHTIWVFFPKGDSKTCD